MRLTQREIDVLTAILQAQPVGLTQLEEQLGLTANQLNYTFTKINAWLSDNGLSWLGTDKDLITVAEPLLVQRALTNFVAHTTPERFRYTSDQMQRFMFLTLLLSEQPGAINRFVDTLYTSRTTVVNLLDGLQQQCASFGLTLKHLNRRGYLIEHDGFKKLTVFVQVLIDTISIRELLGFYYRDNIYSKMGELLLFNLFDLDTLFTVIKETLAYTDSLTSIDDVDFLLLIMLNYQYRQAVQQDGATTLNVEALAELAGEILHNDRRSLDPGQRRLILHINAAMQHAFSLDFQFDEDFVRVLSRHVQRFLFRQANQIQMNDIDVAQFMPEYGEIYTVVKAAIADYPELATGEITPSEIMLIAIYYASAFEQHAQRADVEPYLLVVCAEGVAVSTIVKNKLARLVSADHIDTSSVFDATEAKLTRYDLIISTVPLPGIDAARVLTIDHAFAPDLLQQVRQRLSLTTIAPPGNDVNKFAAIMDAINSTSIGAAELAQLEMQILKILSAPAIARTALATPLVINPALVARVEVSMTWQQAIMEAASGLLAQHLIEAHYVQTIINNTVRFGAYMMVTPGVILAHAGAEDGVNANAIAVTSFDQPIHFPGENTPLVHVIITIALKDDDPHLLMQKLMDWLLMPPTLELLRHFEQKATVVAKLRELFGEGAPAHLKE